VHSPETSDADERAELGQDTDGGRPANAMTKARKAKPMSTWSINRA
jgi:hypothetical protein